MHHILIYSSNMRDLPDYSWSDYLWYQYYASIVNGSCQKNQERIKWLVENSDCFHSGQSQNMYNPTHTFTKEFFEKTNMKNISYEEGFNKVLTGRGCKSFAVLSDEKYTEYWCRFSDVEGMRDIFP